MKPDNMPSVARYWESHASDFDTIYQEEGKGPVARALDRWLRKDMYDRFRWVLEQSGDLRGGSACDIGCGSGRFVAALAKQGARRVVGVDVAPSMLKLAAAHAEAKGVGPSCEFVEADVANWRADDQFDLVIAIGLWDYIADPLGRLKVIRSLTKGRFLSSWPRFWTWRMPIRKARLTLKGCPVYFFRRPRVEQLLRDAGFEIESIEVIGKLFCVSARPAGKP